MTEVRMPEQQPGEVEDRNLRDRHELMAELVTHLREKRSELRQQWVDRISDAHLLSAMTAREVFNEVTSCTTTTSRCSRRAASASSSATPVTSRNGSSPWCGDP